jgi:competence protein ComEC
MFPVYFIIGNILLVPLMAPVLILAFISAVLSFSPFINIAEIFVYPLNDLIGFMIDVTHFTEQLPNAVITNISITNFELLLFGMIFTSILLFNLEVRKSAIFILLSSLILLGISFTDARIRRLRFKAFVVYSQRGVGIFNQIGSDRNTLYLTDSMSTIQQGYICGGYWARHNARNPEVRIVDNTKPQVMSFTVGNKRILLLHRIDELPELIFKPEVDFIVLSGSPRVSIEQIVNSINHEQIIVSTDNKPWVIMRLKREALCKNILFYDVIKQGAWVCETE